MARLSQGTQVYFLDPETKKVVAVQCATNFNPGGAPRDAIDSTCMEDTYSSSIPGLRQNASATLNINADDRYESHYRLWELFQIDDLEAHPWVIGFPGSKSIPTVNTAGTEFVLPEDRTWFLFNGYITDFPLDFESNALITGAITIQRSGGAEWIKSTTTADAGSDA